MKTALVTQSFSLVHQCVKYGKLVGWVMRTRAEVEVSMGRYTIYLMAHTAIRSPVNFCVHCGEFNILVDIVQVVKNVPQPVKTLEPDDKSVIHVMEPAEGFTGCPL
jgi:hypothetical protein